MNTATTSSLPADISAQLAGLRDIRLPGAVSWWPLAPGWWALTLIILTFSLLAFVIYRKRQRSLKCAAIRELTTLADKYGKEENLAQLASEVGVLIRRVALELPEGRRYANVHGTDWIDYLVELPGGMQHSIAQYLAIAPYAELSAVSASLANDPASGEKISRKAIITEADTWIRRHA